MFKSDGGQVHEGHRGRMRDKFLLHGSRIFDTYELLEMLLYYVIPYKDTNPLAKRLLARFGSLDGVLRASAEQLQQVEGIGPAVARFICRVGVLTEEKRFFCAVNVPRIMDNYEETGRFLTKYFRENRSSNIVLILLDDSMRLLGIEDIQGKNFGSAEVKARAFIDLSIRYSATVVIISHCHRYGPDFPTESERATSKMLRDGLYQIGVKVAEHYVVSGDNFCGISSGFAYKLNSDSPELERFLAGKGEGEND